MADLGDTLLENEPFMGGIGDMPGQNTNKRVLVLLIVDATTSMRGQSIGQVNYGIQELFSELREYASSNLVNLQLGILSFTNSIRWEMEPKDIQTCYDVVHIDVRPGLTQYGVVYHELQKMLNKKNLLNYSGKQAAPVLIFMTDGAPSDVYQDDLDVLKKNGYFALSNRSAILMGEGANDPKAQAAVKEFVSDESMILTAGRYTDIVQSIKLATLHTLKNDFQETGTAKIRMPENEPFGGNTSVPGADPFGGSAPAGEADPFGGSAPAGEADPFGGSVPAGEGDPFGGSAPAGEGDPFGGSVPAGEGDPFGGSAPAGEADPFGGSAPAGEADPFGGSAPAGEGDPFGGSAPAGEADPFGGSIPAGEADPFGGSAPAGEADPFGGSAPAAEGNPFGDGNSDSEKDSFGGGTLELEDPFAPKG